jgi:hypothetical protein
MELHERVNKIKTRHDLGQFVGALRAELAANPEEWENPTLDRFLEAMEAWIADSEGYYKNQGQAPADPPTWKTFGDILIAARMYE